MSTAEQGRGERPGRFDAFKLVARRGHVDGAVDPFDLDRVHDVLGDEDGEIPPSEVRFRLEGDVDPQGRTVLHVALEGEVPLQCQRCLRLFYWPVDQHTTVLLAHDEQELAYLDDNDEREVVLAAAPLDPLDIVEEELVLSLPYVPRCERADCVAGAAARDAVEAVPPSSPSPFEALAKKLKPGGNAGQD
jgi:uncharacterized protein